MSVRVALVIVSHSDLLARGVVELAQQMAPDVTILPAGGTGDRQLGTSFDVVQTQIEHASASVPPEIEGGGTVVLCDIGSATMTVESVLDFEGESSHAVLVDAPLVEGAVAAAISAQQGHSVDRVREDAQKAGLLFCYGNPLSASTEDHDFHLTTEEHMSETQPDGGATTGEPQTLTATAVVADPVGLHARPAALLTRLADEFDSDIHVNGADATSALEIMALGIGQGDQVTFSASGSDAEKALKALKDMVESVPQQ